eukprot:COSAG04_NODE_833_length_10004_cov_6.351035_9_plen_279_part_00
MLRERGLGEGELHAAEGLAHEEAPRDRGLQHRHVQQLDERQAGPHRLARAAFPRGAVRGVHRVGERLVDVGVLERVDENRERELLRPVGVRAPPVVRVPRPGRRAPLPLDGAQRRGHVGAERGERRERVLERVRDRFGVDERAERLEPRVQAVHARVRRGRHRESRSEQEAPEQKCRRSAPRADSRRHSPRGRRSSAPRACLCDAPNVANVPAVARALNARFQEALPLGSRKEARLIQPATRTVEPPFFHSSGCPRHEHLQQAHEHRQGRRRPGGGRR